MNLIARPWQPQDLLDELQLMIDELPDSIANNARTTLCTARAYLEEYFNSQKKEPFTLDDLRKMEGKPVYVSVFWYEGRAYNGWAVIHKVETEGFFIQFDGKYHFLLNGWYSRDQEERWLAFRNEPEDGGENTW